MLGIIVEVQLAPDERKRFAWPAYATGLRARIRCPVCLLVVTAHEAVARWAVRPIDLGGGNSFVPLVLGPSGVPEVTDREQARADPELAVLSAMAHGHDADPHKSLAIAFAAMAASAGLDAERSTLYFDLVVSSLSEAARKSLQAMDPAKYEFQSEFAKKYLSQGEARGEARGKAEGKAELVLKQLQLKFGVLTAATQKRVAAASVAQLDRIAERVLFAKTLRDVFATKPKPAKKKR